MGGTSRVRVRGGMLEPVESVDLPEGKELLVTVLDLPAERDFEAFRRAAGGWKGLVDTETLIRNIYADRAAPTKAQNP